MMQKGLYRGFWAARNASPSRVTSLIAARACFASSSSSSTSAAPSAGVAEDAFIVLEPPPPPRPDAGTVPTLLQPRVVVYDGVCHLCHRGAVPSVQRSEVYVVTKISFLSGHHLNQPEIGDASISYIGLGVKWVIKADKHRKIKFCCLQSKAAEPYMRLCGVDREDVLRRFLFIEGPEAYYEGSAAALKVASYLPFPYSALSSLMIVPAPLRDAVYDYVAKRRYDWFGKEEECLVMQEKEMLERFIDRDELLGGGEEEKFL